MLAHVRGGSQKCLHIDYFRLSVDISMNFERLETNVFVRRASGKQELILDDYFDSV